MASVPQNERPPAVFYLPDTSKVSVAGVPGSSVLQFTYSPSSSSPPLLSAGASSWTASISNPSSAVPSLASDTLTINADALGAPTVHLWIVCAYYFSLSAPPNALIPGKPGSPRGTWTLSLNLEGLFSTESYLLAVEAEGLVFHGSTGVVITRPAFWQLPPPVAAGAPKRTPLPPVYTLTNNVRHPVRPRLRPGQEIYRRWVPTFSSFLTFRVATVADAPLLNTWMNNPRVAAFWGEEGSVEKTEEFLRKGLSSRHSAPVIASWEEEAGVPQPFAYYEIYWVKEDHLANHTDTANWDRGFHVLVGEERFRGSQRVRTWLSSLVHYCLLDDPRTMTVYLEPRVDNDKFIRYLQGEGFYKEKEFAFPHKQSALMKLQREAWEGPAV